MRRVKCQKTQLQITLSETVVSKSYLFSAYVRVFHTTHNIVTLLSYNSYEFSVPRRRLQLHGSARDVMVYSCRVCIDKYY